MSISDWLFRARRYLHYRFNAVGKHVLHSPFIFKLYYEVIIPSKTYRISSIENIRKRMHKDHRELEVVDFKTGSNTIVSVAGVAKRSVSTKKFSAFLSLLIRHLKVESVMETGTSVGVNALYMAYNAEKLVSIEGSMSLASIARKNIECSKTRNIEIINSDLYQSLESEIVRNKPQLYFLDADHRSSSIAFCIDLILKHTPDTKCIIIHDIYWSKDMYEMWKKLVEDPRFSLSIDIFQAGILFPKLDMEKQHFTLRF